MNFSMVFETTGMTDFELRHVQLREIRALLRLPVEASHEEVIRTLVSIGQTDKRIDLEAIPVRYRR